MMAGKSHLRARAMGSSLLEMRPGDYCDQEIVGAPQRRTGALHLWMQRDAVTNIPAHAFTQASPHGINFGEGKCEPPLENPPSRRVQVCRPKDEDDEINVACKSMIDWDNA
jgi:hypothetical protein